MTDEQFEAMMREALAEKTEIIQPSPDGLTRIFQGIDARRPWYARAAELALSLAIAIFALACTAWAGVQILDMILRYWAR